MIRLILLSLFHLFTSLPFYSFLTMTFLTFMFADWGSSPERNIIIWPLGSWMKCVKAVGMPLGRVSFSKA